MKIKMIFGLLLGICAIIGTMKPVHVQAAAPQIIKEDEVTDAN